MKRYDAIVIGSGPAGIEAAINLKIRNKAFLLFGSEALSHKLVMAAQVDNYLGLPAISGPDLQAKFLSHMRQMDISVLAGQVQAVYPMGDFFALTTSRENYEATAILLATGISHSKPLPGEEAFLGRGVGYCATCDGPLYRGKTVAVLGYTDEAAHEADYLAELAKKVYYFPMKKNAALPGPPVEIRGGPATAVTGDTQVRSLATGDGPLPVDGVFILRDAVAPASLLPGIETDGGFIRVDSDMRTNIPGCFAAGDCTGRPHQFMRAAGQGQTAALAAVGYIDGLRKGDARG